MQNDYLKDVLIELQNIYVELKANKDKRMYEKALNDLYLLALLHTGYEEKEL